MNEFGEASSQATTPSVIPESASRLAALQRHVNWQSLVRGVEIDPDSTSEEVIYPLPNMHLGGEDSGKNLVGLTDDLAVVVYTAPEHPHKHVGDETETHIGAAGHSAYIVGGEEKPMKRGEIIVITPDTPHFAAVSAGTLAVFVVSSPSFNPDNQQELSRDIPLEAATLDTYDSLVEQRN
jgi:mannose-6-phosphate isomerase-like protein (cupin superfamily)